MEHWTGRIVWLATLACVLFATRATAGELKLLLPLGRTAYQTNERIDLAVVRSAAAALSTGSLELRLDSSDGSQMRFAFPVQAVPVQNGIARATEHLYINGWLLRPGHYRVQVACDDASMIVEIDVYTHLRRSNFKLLNWGRAKGKAQLTEGEDSLGFNVFYGHYASDDQANFIRAGMDFMPCCTMGGGHQMDLRSECDWSDAYVVRGGTARVVQRALMLRTRPNVPGIHFYDEPGLTWWKHAKTGDWTPHGLPSQVRSYVSAFGRQPISYHDVDPTNPDHVRQWKHWATWKLGFMDAAWQDARFGVSYVEPSYISVTQSQYGFTAFTDGYYFNVARSLPIVSGHGGYHDWGPGYFNPSYTLEMARARDFAKPCWYLPTWYGNTTADHFRLEQYLSFQTNIQGMMCPPDIDPYEPANKPAAEGLVESNLLMAHLGTIFHTMPVTRPPVALLYSLSHVIHAQTKDRTLNYAHAIPHGENLPLAYLAGKLIHHQFLAVVDEDVVDGTLAAHHRAVILTSLDYLAPAVLTALEDFAAAGGLVLLTADCTVKVKGATTLPVAPAMPDAATIKELAKEKKYKEMEPYVTTGKYIQGAMPLAKAIQAQLVKAGIRPIFACDNPGIAATRQAAGDVEYLFAVNAEYDFKAGEKLSIKPAVASIALPADRRPVYDAVRGGAVAELARQGTQLKGTLRFGPGQMRVFARTARPIGSVKALAPIVQRDLTADAAPIGVNIGAVVLDAQRAPLSGSMPLCITLTDPLGVTRYTLYRATQQGMLRLSLPLAANDPAGEWKVAVRELLSHTTDTATFVYQPLARCAALAGAAHRAACFAADIDQVFRFVRVNQDVTIVTGTSGYNAAAATRLAESLEPWDVRCKIVAAADVNRPRELTPEEAPTWVGIEFGRAKVGRENHPAKVGFDVKGPVILLGTPKDNPLIAHLLKMKFLPYEPKADEFPGRGRGYLAWQRDGVGHRQESVTLIAYDAKGMSEAVGSFYEAVAGLRPLTRWTQPSKHTVVAATTAPDLVPEPKVAWRAVLPDRAVALQADGARLVVTTHDGSRTVIAADGKVVEQKAVATSDAAAAPKVADASLILARKHCPADRIVKHAVPHGALTAVGYWGGTLQLLAADGTVKFRTQMPQDITGLASLGGRLAVGLADGCVVAVVAK